MAKRKKTTNVRTALKHKSNITTDKTDKKKQLIERIQQDGKPIDWATIVLC